MANAKPSNPATRQPAPYMLIDPDNGDRIISRHRMLSAAARALRRYNRAFKRRNGAYAYNNVTLVHADGGPLTVTERSQFAAEVFAA